MTTPQTAAGPLADLFPADFAGRSRVEEAALSFGRELAAEARNPAWAIQISPGVLRMAGNDLELSYWADRRAIEPRLGKRRESKRGQITSWTRKSRAKMVIRLATLDWSYLSEAVSLPAMVTLTYPADWLPVAPDGESVKCHLKALLKRWERAWGEPLRGAWKLEFQARGAPHVHIGPVLRPLGKAGAARRAAYEAEVIAWQAAGSVGRRPYFRPGPGDGLGFREWLSFTWAHLVNHPDPEERAKHLTAGTNVSVKEGLRCTDAKRLAVYFTKHGIGRGKEYQHECPAEWREAGSVPGRFWGYWGLSPCTAVVPLDRSEHLAISRTLRKLSERSHVWNPATRQLEVVKATREVTVWRRQTNPLTGEVKARRRKVRRPVRRLRYHRGFVCVNDAPKLAAALVRLVQ